MEQREYSNNGFDNRPIEQIVTEQQILDLDTQEISRTFISNVFTWMFIALSISGIVSWYFAQSTMFESVFITGSSIVKYGIMFAPLIFVIAMGSAYRRLSFQTLALLFVLFAVVMGISFSFIFHVYPLGSITSIFFASSAIFAIMAVAGYRTSIDLTKMGSILFMGLIGIIVASIINMFFIKSEGFDLLISYVGVLIFVGLTAYHMQRIKMMAAMVEVGDEESKKMALFGALNLYITFINLFLTLLRLFGSRN